MDKGAKFEFQQTIETYLEENHVYELFEDLLQQLLVAKPDKPLDYLIEMLEKPPSKYTRFIKFLEQI